MFYEISILIVKKIEVTLIFASSFNALKICIELCQEGRHH